MDGVMSVLLLVKVCGIFLSVIQHVAVACSWLFTYYTFKIERFRA